MRERERGGGESERGREGGGGGARELEKGGETGERVCVSKASSNYHLLSQVQGADYKGHS